MLARLGRATPAVIAALACILAAATPSLASPRTTVWIQGETGDDEWFAIRFNVTPGSDINVVGTYWIFFGSEERNGGMTIAIKDGVPGWQLSGPSGSGSNWLPHMEWGHVATPLVRVDVGDANGSNPQREGWFFGGGEPSLQVQRSVTFMGIVQADRGYFTANATWTHGVTSYDVATGPAIIRQADDLDLGVHAGSYSWLAPRAAAGALLTETLHTERDFLGWFLPESNYTSVFSRWSCTEDGIDCPPPGWGPDSAGLVRLVSKGPTQWDSRHRRDGRDSPVGRHRRRRASGRRLPRRLAVSRKPRPPQRHGTRRSGPSALVREQCHTVERASRAERACRS